MSASRGRDRKRPAERGWSDVLADQEVDEMTVRRLVVQLRACEAAALSFCRLLERWARGEPEPATAGGGKRRSGARPTAPRRR